MTEIPFARVRHWMFEEALPFWAEHGVDREFGGFLEELTFDGKPTDVDFKRVRVTCRQLYAFSHAALLGWSEGRALSDRAYEYLLAKARTPDGVWARLLTLRTMGIPAPRYRGMPMFRFWLSRTTMKQKLQSVFGTVKRVLRKGLGRRHDMREFTPPGCRAALIGSDRA